MLGLTINGRQVKPRERLNAVALPQQLHERVLRKVAATSSLGLVGLFPGDWIVEPLALVACAGFTAIDKHDPCFLRIAGRMPNEEGLIHTAEDARTWPVASPCG